MYRYDVYEYTIFKSKTYNISYIVYDTRIWHYLIHFIFLLKRKFYIPSIPSPYAAKQFELIPFVFWQEDFVMYINSYLLFVIYIEYIGIYQCAN